MNNTEGYEGEHMVKRRFFQIALTVLLLPLAACSFGTATSAPPGAPTSTPFLPLTAATPDSSVAGFAFKTSGYTLHAWPTALDLFQPSYYTPSAYRDSSGVVMHQLNGQDYNHPVAQAQDGLGALATYQQNGDQVALQTAMADANRLLDTHTEYAGAWWYPYPFDFALFGIKSDTAHAPWYSGMAQGEALDLFTRLYLQTHDEKWHTAATNTFASFLHPYSGDVHVPWAINVASGYLWIQEYPEPQPDYTINGAFFATAGIVKYALTFGDQRATYIADGSMTTMLHFISQVRHPGWISSYSLSHMEDQSAHYHGIVTNQLALMYSITRDTHYAEIATQFISDYPDPRVSGAISVPPGTYALGQTSENEGRIESTTQVTLDSAIELQVNLRVKMQNAADYWYEIADGPYMGSWIEESAAVHLVTPVNVVNFSPPLPFTLSGAYHVYTLQQGDLQTIGAMNTDPAQPVSLSEHATIDTIDVWQVASGEYAGDYVSGAAPTLAA